MELRGADISTVGLLIAIGLVVAAGTTWLERWSRNRRLAKRPSLTPEEVFAAYYKNGPISFQEFLPLWKQIALLLRADSGRLRPTDKLVALVGVARHLSIFSDVDAIHELARPANVIAEQRLATLDDVIRAAIGGGPPDASAGDHGESIGRKPD